MDMGCTHHWVIAPPDGREPLPGRCRRCGAERSFRSAAPESDDLALVWLVGRALVETPAALPSRLGEAARRGVAAQRRRRDGQAGPDA